MPLSELVRHVLGLAAGFILPGWLVARRLGTELRWGSAFVLSLLLLFHAVFLTGILGAPVRLPWVAAALALLTGAAWALAGRIPGGTRPASAPALAASRPTPSATRNRLAAAAALVFCAAVLLGATRAPICEWDNPFRWGHLAGMIYSLGTFSFYPPLTAADFGRYFAVDAIPPLVPFSYWWVYATAGRLLPALTGSLVAAQFAAAAAFTAAAAASLFGPGARWWAAGTLASSLLFVNAIEMGQETGMTAIAVAGTVAFLSRDERGRGPAPVVMAGLASALGLLSREYGWAFLLVGVLMLAWRGAGARRILLYLAVASLVGAPWYARTLLLTGNPFYSNSLGPLPVNEVFAEVVHFCHRALRASAWGIPEWLSILRHLTLTATLPLLIGGAACLVSARRHGYLGLSVLLVFLLWLLSVGYTSGGPLYAARMLTPALVLLSIAAGGLLARLTAGTAVRSAVRSAVLAVVAAACTWSLLAALLHPYAPWSLPLGSWPAAATKRYESGYAREWATLTEILPPGARVLGDNAYLYVWLRPHGIQVVPIWSPEVAFIADRSLPAAEVRRRLIERGIRHVWFQRGLNGDFLIEKFRLYREEMARWRPVFETPGGVLLELPVVEYPGP